MSAMLTSGASLLTPGVDCRDRHRFTRRFVAHNPVR